MAFHDEAKSVETCCNVLTIKDIYFLIKYLCWTLITVQTTLRQEYKQKTLTT